MRAMAMMVAALWIGVAAVAATPDVVPGYKIDLARDAGSHPDFTTEWWYLTGWLQDGNGTRRGFQVTFFRSRNAAADSNPSKFSPRQILFAHTALSDPAEKKLLRGERTARAGFGLAEAEHGAMRVLIDDWFIKSEGTKMLANVMAENFALALSMQATQPPLMQGDNGYSRKGFDTDAASYYYSLPQLAVTGSITVHGKAIAVTGEAWFDHEWSNAYLDPQSVGWDWIGINMNNGDALMAFRMRDAMESQRWASAKWRHAGESESFDSAQSNWTPLRRWRSPRTGVEYPVAWRIKLGSQSLVLQPLMDDQESDARSSVGILYWEGAVTVNDATGYEVGRGYLELVGYAAPVHF